MPASLDLNSNIAFSKASKLYDDGHYEVAFAQFLALAKKGDASAMVNVALMYGAGQGTATNFEESIRWDLRAVEAGEVTAMLNLAVSYRESGQIDAAASWLEKALAAGDFEAAIELAKINLDGKPDAARAYLELALHSGKVCDASHEEAMALLRTIA